MGSIRSQAGVRLSHFEGETKTIFLKCSKSRSKTEMDRLRSYESNEPKNVSPSSMTTVLPEKVKPKDGLSCDRVRSFWQSFDVQSALKVALPDEILH